MKRVLIVGAGGFGRELFFWAQQHPDHGMHWAVSGFLDDVNRLGLPAPIIDPIDGYVPRADDLLLMGIGLPKVRQRVGLRLLERGAEFLTFVHPDAIIGERSTLARGTVVCPRVIVTVDVTVGEFVVLNCGAGVGHDAKIGDWSTLGPKAELTGGVVAGQGVNIGAGAIVAPGCRLGDWCTLGSNAAVFTNARPGVTMVGNPARTLAI